MTLLLLLLESMRTAKKEFLLSWFSSWVKLSTFINIISERKSIHTWGLPWGLPEVVGTVQQVHCSRRRLLRRGLEFHVCTIYNNPTLHPLKINPNILRKMFLTCTTEVLFHDHLGNIYVQTDDVCMGSFWDRSSVTSIRLTLKMKYSIA